QAVGMADQGRSLRRTWSLSGDDGQPGSKEEAMFERWCSDVFWGTGRRVRILAAASLIAMVSVATSRAGDISGQPGNGLSVTNSATDLLPQAAAGAPPPLPGEAAGGLAGLHVSGYVS